MATGKNHDHRLYISIAKEIRELIEEGVYRPGDRLPPLAELAVQYGCSRATVREALGALRGQGLVEFRHGNGTYVRTATVEMWMEPLEAAILLGTNHLEELLELQVSLLAGVVSFAADRIQSGEHSVLMDSLFRLECAKTGSEESTVAELAFYNALASVSKNSLLENSVRVLQEGLRSILRMGNKQETTRGLMFCRHLFDTVTKHQGVMARQLVFQYGAELLRSIREARYTPRAAGDS